MQDVGGSAVLALAPVLGEATTLAASTESVNAGFLRLLAGALSAGALVVLFTAVWLVRRRRRRRPARRARRRPGFPVTGGR